MSESVPTFQYHCNRYNAQAACEHCEGVIRHERWCITRDQLVYYAYQVVADPSKLTLGDSLILHSRGVVWGPKQCNGDCAKKAPEPSSTSVSS
ncbi:MAG: hypothetical protein WCA99_06130 [Candidatus Sulfotelmatobacter sp.]